MPKIAMIRGSWLWLLAFVAIMCLSACGATTTAFVVKDRRQIEGEKTTKTVPVANSGSETLVQDTRVEMPMRHDIDLTLSEQSLNEQEVRDKIYNFYKIKKIDDKKVCVIPVEVPGGKTFQYDIEWTEVLREGIIEEGENGGGRQLGTYTMLEDITCQVIGLHSD